MLRKILLVLFAILIVIQFIRPEKNNSTTASLNDITKHYAVPDEVVNILKQSCYDCHSNHTVYPWYFSIQPVAWWMQNHVDDGKREINFSEFNSYPPKRQSHKLHSIVEQIKRDEMPLDSYLWIHKYAKLNEDQKKAIINWADSLQQVIIRKNNLPAETEEHHRD